MVNKKIITSILVIILISVVAFIFIYNQALQDTEAEQAGEQEKLQDLTSDNLDGALQDLEDVDFTLIP